MRVGQPQGSIGSNFLLSRQEWIRFMIACLLLEPLADIRYIAHRMLVGKPSLRLTDVPSQREGA